MREGDGQDEREVVRHEWEPKRSGCEGRGSRWEGRMGGKDEREGLPDVPAQGRQLHVHTRKG